MLHTDTHTHTGIHIHTCTHRHTYIYTTEYEAAIKRNEMMSFAEIWIKREGINLRKLTQEQKTKQNMFSLISES